MSDELKSVQRAVSFLASVISDFVRFGDVDGNILMDIMRELDYISTFGGLDEDR